MRLKPEEIKEQGEEEEEKEEEGGVTTDGMGSTRTSATPGAGMTVGAPGETEKSMKGEGARPRIGGSTVLACELVTAYDLF
jgi:hypothetical protein